MIIITMKILDIDQEFCIKDIFKFVFEYLQI